MAMNNMGTSSRPTFTMRRRPKSWPLLMCGCPVISRIKGSRWVDLSFFCFCGFNGNDFQFNDYAWNHPLTPKPRPDFRDVKVGGMGVPTMGTDVDHFHQCVGKPSSVLPAAEVASCSFWGSSDDGQLPGQFACRAAEGLWQGSFFLAGKAIWWLNSISAKNSHGWMVPRFMGPSYKTHVYIVVSV